MGCVCQFGKLGMHVFCRQRQQSTQSQLAGESVLVKFMRTPFASLQALALQACVIAADATPHITSSKS